MTQYLFEVYKNDIRGKVFIGYRKIAATSYKEAEILLKEKEGDVQLAQIYFNFENR